MELNEPKLSCHIPTTYFYDYKHENTQGLAAKTGKHRESFGLNSLGMTILALFNAEGHISNSF